MTTMTDLWTWRFVVSSELVNDEPMFRTVLDHQSADARLAAHEQGTTLTGDPATVRQPLVLVDGWHDDGRPELVAEEIARAVDCDAPVSAVQFVLTWKTAV